MGRTIDLLLYGKASLWKGLFPFRLADELCKNKP